MKRKAILIFILCLFLASVFPLNNSHGVANSSGDSEAHPTMDSWPTFHHDLAHTGYSTSTAPLKNQTLWTYTTGGDVNDPAVVDGVVYVGSYDDHVYALNAKNGDLIWNYTTGGYVDTSPTVSNGVVFVNSDDNKTYALNAANGALIWSYTTKRRLDSSPAVAGGEVFTCSADHNVYALNAANGALIWKYTTGGNIMLSSPAVADNVVFIGADHKVYALNAIDGALIWNYTARGGVDSSPAVVGGIVFAGSTDHNVYALNATDGALIWKHTTGGYVDSGPAVADEMVFVGSADRNVYALNATNGVPVWNYTTGDIVASSPAVADNVVFVGSLDHKVYALNATDGALIWSYTTGGVVVSSPAVVDGVVYLGSWDHKVYAFGSSSNIHYAPVLDLIVILLGVGIAISSLLLFVWRRKGEKQPVNSTVQENSQKPKGIPVTKLEVTDATARFFAAKGFLKKRWTVVKEIPVYEMTAIEIFRNELGVTWKGVIYTFSVNEKTDSLSKFHDKVNGMLEEHHKLLERNEKATLRRNELLGVINASIGIIDSSFDILTGLQEKRINWQRLEGYSNGFGEHLNFTGQSMPPLNIDFSKVVSAIKRQIPRETSEEAYDVLQMVYGYFNGLNLDDDIKEIIPNFQSAKAVVLAYFLSNDILLGTVVGDDENKEEKSQLKTVLLNLANTSKFKVNVDELERIMDKTGLEIDTKSAIEDSRGIFKEQLNRFNRMSANYKL